MNERLFEMIAKAQFRRALYAPDECKGIVYIVQFANVYKIGHTSIDVQERIKQFSKIRMPFRFQPVFQCRCLNPELTERWVHKELRQHRLDGEWFALDDELLLLAKSKILSMADCIENEQSQIEPVMTGLKQAPWDSRAGYINELVGVGKGSRQFETV